MTTAANEQAIDAGNTTEVQSPDATDNAEQYFATFEPGDSAVAGAQPWGLFKVTGAQVARWIPSRNAYVPVRDHHDFVTKGMSSEAKDAKEITPEEAEGFQDQVKPMDESWVKRYEIVPA